MIRFTKNYLVDRTASDRPYPCLEVRQQWNKSGRNNLTKNVRMQEVCYLCKDCVK
jgi:hypothetical protein